MIGASRLAVLAAGAVASWALTPWVAMAARGTVDSRHREAVRRLGTDVAAPMPAAWRTVPDQARPADGAGVWPARIPSGAENGPPRPAP